MAYIGAFVILIVMFIVPAAIVTAIVAQPGGEVPITRATQVGPSSGEHQ